MTLRFILVLLAMAVVVGIPFLLRPADNVLAAADDTLVILSPHNEAIRYEFTHAFRQWYEKKTGRTVRLDWRVVGGTSEIAKYLQSEFFTAFKRDWEAQGQVWSPEVAAAFDQGSLRKESATPAAWEARQAFLSSTTGIGVDLFFGGGAYDFSRQARAGRLVPSQVLQNYPAWFEESSIPAMVSGEEFYDPEGRWIGTCLSAFGIVFNRDSLERLGFETIPSSWQDLTDPRFYKQVALADPTKSGSAAKAFEMVIQQQMQERVAATGDLETGLREGWLLGLQIIQQASANARYFTDAASKVPMDVSLGDAAIGMCIDFYGRFQSEAVRVADGTSRLEYFTPAGGSSVGVDPIGLLRGAPNRDVAEAFIEFVLSLEGQKLWDFKVGTPGGPVRYALRRPPIRKELYTPEFNDFRSDPGVNPYTEAAGFIYHPEWTAPLFRTISFLVRVACLDSHDEQASAWREMIRHGMPPEAVGHFSDFSIVNYDVAREEIAPALSSPDRIEEVKLSRELAARFREQYAQAAQIARHAARQDSFPPSEPNTP